MNVALEFIFENFYIFLIKIDVVLKSKWLLFLQMLNEVYQIYVEPINKIVHQELKQQI